MSSVFRHFRAGARAAQIPVDPIRFRQMVRITGGKCYKDKATSRSRPRPPTPKLICGMALTRAASIMPSPVIAGISCRLLGSPFLSRGKFGRRSDVRPTSICRWAHPYCGCPACEKNWDQIRAYNARITPDSPCGAHGSTPHECYHGSHYETTAYKLWVTPESPHGAHGTTRRDSVERFGKPVLDRSARTLSQAGSCCGC